MVVPPFYGVYKDTVNQHAEVEMVPAGQTGLSGVSDSISLFHFLPFNHIDTAQMTVQGGYTLSMVNNDGEAVNAVSLGEKDPAVITCFHKGICKGGEVNSQMNLFVDLFTLIIICLLYTSDAADE